MRFLLHNRHTGTGRYPEGHGEAVNEVNAVPYCTTVIPAQAGIQRGMERSPAEQCGLPYTTVIPAAAGIQRGMERRSMALA